MSSPTPQSLSNIEIFIRRGWVRQTLRENHISSQFNEPKRNPPTADGFGQTEAQTTLKKQTDLSGYESAQRKRFLRAEIEEEKLAAAAGRRHLLKLERQVA